MHGGGLGASVIPPFSSMMWRGCANWPLRAAVASLPSCYFVDVGPWLSRSAIAPHPGDPTRKTPFFGGAPRGGRSGIVKARVLHVAGKSEPSPPRCAGKRETRAPPTSSQHLGGGQLFEAAPAQAARKGAPAVIAFGIKPPHHRLPGAQGLRSYRVSSSSQAADEQAGSVAASSTSQGFGDAATPEGISRSTICLRSSAGERPRRAVVRRRCGAGRGGPHVAIAAAAGHSPDAEACLGGGLNPAPSSRHQGHGAFSAGPHGHHMILGSFEFLIAEGFIGQIQTDSARTPALLSLLPSLDQGEQAR